MRLASSSTQGGDSSALRAAAVQKAHGDVQEQEVVVAGRLDANREKFCINALQQPPKS